jgi:hypothetical protein
MTTFVSGPTIVCSTAAALTATPNASMLSGSVAYVVTFGAYWVLQATGPAPDASTVLAAADGRVWVRSLSGVQEAALAQATWYVDGANSTGVASDENPGTALLPLLHVAEIVRRWGTNTPAIAQATVINIMSNSLASDPWTAIPSFPGAGQLQLQGVLSVAQTTTIGVFAAAVRGGANTLASITSPGVPSWAGKSATLIHDTTVNATFFVSADLGAGVASITNPVAFPINPAGAAPAAVALANGDTIQIFNPPPTLFVQRVAFLAFGSAGGLTLLDLTVKANLLMNLEGISSGECVFATGQRGEDPTGCTFQSCFLQSGYTGVGVFRAGQLSAFSTFQGPQNSLLDGDVIVPGNITLSSGALSLGSVYLSAGIINQKATSLIQTVASTYGPSGRALLWGPGTLNVANGAQCDASAGGTAVQKFVNTGGLQLDGVATGSTFTVATGLWSAGAIALTPAAVDANGMLTNPNKTGSRIHV